MKKNITYTQKIGDDLNDPVVDRKYYEGIQANPIAGKMMELARRRMYRMLCHLHCLGPDHEILDVGVSDVIMGADNMLERLHPYPARITAAGLGEGEEFCRSFPEIAYSQIQQDRPLPFPDNSFDLATSNAVLEHLGSVDAQHKYVAELLRVARSVFVTVPNGWFPVEHHTGIAFAHWNQASFRWACAVKGKSRWADPSELILMSADKLRFIADLVARNRQWKVGWTGLPLGPFSSNLYLSILKK